MLICVLSWRASACLGDVKSPWHIPVGLMLFTAFSLQRRADWWLCVCCAVTIKCLSNVVFPLRAKWHSLPSTRGRPCILIRFCSSELCRRTPFTPSNLWLAVEMCLDLILWPLTVNLWRFLRLVFCVFVPLSQKIESHSYSAISF